MVGCYYFVATAANVVAVVVVESFLQEQSHVKMYNVI